MRVVIAPDGRRKCVVTVFVDILSRFTRCPTGWVSGFACQLVDGQGDVGAPRVLSCG